MHQCSPSLLSFLSADAPNIRIEFVYRRLLVDVVYFSCLIWCRVSLPCVCRCFFFVFKLVENKQKIVVVGINSRISFKQSNEWIR